MACVGHHLIDKNGWPLNEFDTGAKSVASGISVGFGVSRPKAAEFFSKYTTAVTGSKG